MTASSSGDKTISDKKYIFANTLLLTVSVSLVLIIGEGFYRYTFSAWPFHAKAKEIHYLTEKDINLRWRFSPGNGRNSLGLRNKEITQKEENTFRILFLGDSLIWTGDTSNGKLYTEVVEVNLNNILNTDKKIEVINAGIPGYTTYQELEFLNVYGLDMQPDLVVLGFVFNDVYYKYLHTPTEKKLLATEPETYLNRFDTSVFPGTLFDKSYLAHEAAYIFQRAHNKLNSFPYFRFDHRNDFYLAWKKHGWNNSDKLIGTMHKQLLERDIPLIIAIFPIVDQVDDKYLNMGRDYVLYPQSMIKEIGNKYGISHIDMTDALYKNGGKELYADYLHLNGKGNDIIASEFTKFLSASIPSYVKKKQ